MKKAKIYKSLSILLASVWIINGLYCKVLNLVPRHQQIVGYVLGEEFAREFTLLIGVLEVIMGILILIDFRPRIIALLQAIAVIIMNIIEFQRTPDLLLWGQFNIVFALLFVFIVVYHGFYLHPKNKILHAR